MPEDPECGHAPAHVGTAKPAGLAFTADDVRIHHDAIVPLNVLHCLAAIENAPDVFVSQDTPRCCGMLGWVRENVKIRAANAGAFHLQQHVIRCFESWICDLSQGPASRALEDYCLHSGKSLSPWTQGA